MKTTAIAPANIAFIKYWGKKESGLRLPLNSSISMNLSSLYSTTTVDFSPDFKADRIFLLKNVASHKIQRPLQFVCDGFNSKEAERIKKHLDRIRLIKKTGYRAKVVTQNNFPMAGGIASSASGFAALTVAAAASLGLKLSEKELSILARLGSGSACRSIPDGIVEWLKGVSSETSYAHSLYPANHWDLRDILLILDEKRKKTGSTAGMEKVKTSPFWEKRIDAVPLRISKLKDALKNKDFSTFGKVIEEDCLDMHRVMQTQNPPLIYLSDLTREIMKKVREWRTNGLAVYFTIDAGPNVHLICEGENEEKIIKLVKTIKEIRPIIVNRPARGAHLIDKHLF